MKNATINTLVKVLFFSAVLALVTLGTALTANAQEKGRENVEIRYVGAVGSKPIFLVEFDNADEDEVFVTLRDADGNILYSEKNSSKRFSKRFQLDRADEDMQLTLSLFSKKGRLTQQFQISRNTRIVEDVTVTKMR